MCDNKQCCVDEIERLSNSVQRLRDENKRLTAELEQAKAAQENPVMILCRVTGDGATAWHDHQPLIPGSSFHKRRARSKDWELMPVYAKAAPVAVPDGWTIKRHMGGITVLFPGDRGGVHLSKDTQSHEQIAHTMLYELADTMLNAAPPAPAVDEQASDVCDPDIYKNGEVIGIFDMTREQADAFCLEQTTATGRPHDWHRAAGRVVVKAARLRAQQQGE